MSLGQWISYGFSISSVCQWSSIGDPLREYAVCIRDSDRFEQTSLRILYFYKQQCAAMRKHCHASSVLSPRILSHLPSHPISTILTSRLCLWGTSAHVTRVQAGLPDSPKLHHPCQEPVIIQGLVVIQDEKYGKIS